MMHDLLDDTASASMNRIRNFAPTRNLRRAVNAWHVGVAMPLNTDRSRLGDIKSCGGTLRIIFGIQRRGHAARAGPHAGQCRHNDTVWEFERTKFDRCEEDVC